VYVLRGKQATLNFTSQAVYHWKRITDAVYDSAKRGNDSGAHPETHEMNSLDAKKQRLTGIKDDNAGKKLNVSFTVSQTPNDVRCFVKTASC